MKVKVCPKCKQVSNMLKRSFPNYVEESICFFPNGPTSRLRDEDYYIDSPIYSDAHNNRWKTEFFCTGCNYLYKGNDIALIVLDEMVEKEDET